MDLINGFSKLSKDEKIDFIQKQFLTSEDKALFHTFSKIEESYEVLSELSENTLCQFPVPYGVAPNFLINNKSYCVPMVIEESSVIAAASRAAKFWAKRGGFKARVKSFVKTGDLHFSWKGDTEWIKGFIAKQKSVFFSQLAPFENSMKKRGGGIIDISLNDFTDKLDHYYSLELKVNTCDAMGANFINTLLESLGVIFRQILPDDQKENLNIIMAILSNEGSDCIVEAECRCPINELSFDSNTATRDFAEKFKWAIDIANSNIKRAVTHNKGIMNGIDAVVLATGNDFRAIEAAAHAYASRSGSYKSLSSVEFTENEFIFKLELPMSIGTIGGLTSLHPLARASFELLNIKSAQELMMIIASVGLAQNFAAVSSLITTGIQKGHMKMHLLNIARQFDATPEQIDFLKDHFSDKVVSVSSVRGFLEQLNKTQ